MATVFFLLSPDIFPDGFLIRSDCGDEVTTCPKILARKVLFPPHVRPGNMNGTFAFYVTHDLRNRILGWYRDQHVYMIGQKVPLYNVAILLHGEVTKCFSQILPQFPIQHLLPALRYPHHMILAFPFRMG